MEVLAIFIGLALFAFGFLGPILAIVGLVRGSGTLRRLAGLEVRLEQLEARLSALTKTLAAERRRPAEEVAPVEAPAGAAAPPVVRPPAPAAPAPLLRPAPAEPPGAAVPAPPLPVPSPGLPPVPAPPPALTPTEGVARVPAPARVSASSTAAAPRSEAPPPRPPTPPPPRPAPPPSPPPPSFDWESLLGLKGAAWLGGIAIVIAGLFLVKLAYDRGYFTPELRLAALLVAGVGSLVWAELSLRKGYATTANAVSGAGIALLYIAFYGGHALWHLFPVGIAFGAMILVTVLAGVVAVRYDAVFTAVLGLLGGFATPVLLSTGEDRPIGLFGYILLLNLGLLAVAARKGWQALTILGLVGTVIIEIGWFFRFMTPEKTAVGLGAFLMFGLLYLWLPSLAKDEEDQTLRSVAGAGAAVPFLFALAVASRRSFAGEWPLLFGYLALLQVALGAIALLRGRVGLLVAGAAGTAVALPLWALQGISRTPPWGPLLAAIALAAIPNALPRLARRFDPRGHRDNAEPHEAAGVIATFGLGFFGLALALLGPAEPPWPFLFLTAALLALLVERTGEEDRLSGIWTAGCVTLALLVQVWFHRVTAGEAVLQNLGLPLLLAVALSLIAGRRAQAPVDANEDEAGVVSATGIALLGLFGCLASPERGSDLRPLFAGMLVLLVLLLVSGLRRDWTALVPSALAASAFFFVVWQADFFQPDDVLEFLPACIFLYLAFLVLPFLVRTWRDRPLPWLTSALAGPAFFFPLYRASSRGLGEAWIGLLPVAMAAATVAALARVSTVFAARPTDTRASHRRLRFLALFAAVALGFVALAIPLQLDRQWITVGWALEAAAVWWLFGRLPHPGLKYLGAVLYVFVGVRLLFNWSNVLRYEERGLPILNWILYTYGVPALCCLVGAFLLGRAEQARRGAPNDDVMPGDRRLLAPAASLLGLILVFALINLEIIDYFGSQRHLELAMERHLARDLAMSVAWGVYAIVLLLVGLFRGVRALRIVSLAFLLLTVAKVFLYDLSQLTGLHRVLSFLGLGAALIVVSLLYQRFVLSSKERS